MTKIKDNRFLFTFDLWWTAGTYRISLYKFLSRVCLFYDGKQDPIEFMDCLKNSDAYLWKDIKPKLKTMLEGYIPIQVMTDKDPLPHNNGFITWKFPPKSLDIGEKPAIL